MMQENNKTMRILIAGFGGQGVLFLGKLIAYAGVLKGKQVTWLPSYGPEMRGGTANCAVILSDGPIGSPIVSEPDVLIAMNLPSFSAYEQKVRPGGTIVLDASLIPDARARTDVSYRALPATRLAGELMTRLVEENGAGELDSAALVTVIEGMLAGKIPDA